VAATQLQCHGCMTTLLGLLPEAQDLSGYLMMAARVWRSPPPGSRACGNLLMLKAVG